MGETIQIPKLKGREDFRGWKDCMYNMLVVEGLVKFVTGYPEEPASADAKEAWETKRARTNLYLVMAVSHSETLLSQLENSGWNGSVIAPKEKWDLICSVVPEVTARSVGLMFHDLVTLRVENFDSLQAYLNRLGTLRAQLKVNKPKLDDSVYLMAALYCSGLKDLIPIEWEWWARDDAAEKLTWESFTKELTQFAQSQKLPGMAAVPARQPANFGGKQSNGGNKKGGKGAKNDDSIECTRCNRRHKRYANSAYCTVHKTCFPETSACWTCRPDLKRRGRRLLAPTEIAGNKGLLPLLRCVAKTRSAPQLPRLWPPTSHGVNLLTNRAVGEAVVPNLHWLTCQLTIRIFILAPGFERYNSKSSPTGPYQRRHTPAFNGA